MLKELRVYPGEERFMKIEHVWTLKMIECLSHRLFNLFDYRRVGLIPNLKINRLSQIRLFLLLHNFYITP